MISNRESADVNNENLEEYFKQYIINMVGRKPVTAGKYFGALKTISKILKDKSMVENDIFEADSLEQLDRLWDVVSNDPEFVQLNKRGDHMYSGGFNHYRNFVTGNGFSLFGEKVSFFDKPMTTVQEANAQYIGWKRSSILRTQILEAANYSCEIDEGHESFLAAKNNKPYMEAHHIIPMRLQGMFEYSLDVYANIICLCPLGHRRIHYAIETERRKMLEAIYKKRKERLKKCGIELSKEVFEIIISNK